MYTSILPLAMGLLLSATAAASDSCAVMLTISPLHIPQGGTAVMRLRPAASVEAASAVWKDRTIDFYPADDNASMFAFLPVDLGEPPAAHTVPVTVTGRGGRKSFHTLSFTVTKTDFPAQHLTLPKNQVSLSKKNLERNKRERHRLQQAFDGAMHKRFWHGKFLQPVAGSISTAFGVRRFLNNKPRSPHTGIDIKAADGTPVYAAGDGRVVLTGNHFFTGNSIFVDHGMGIVSMYFHLSSMLVSQGQNVVRGQVIGRVGSSGRSTGPHLHWGLRIHGQRVDPQAFSRLTAELNDIL